MKYRIPLVLALSITPLPIAGAQSIHMPEITSAPSLVSRCPDPSGTQANPVLVQVRSTLAEPEDARGRMRLQSLQDSLEGILAVDPDRTEDRYLLAVVLGGRSELAGGRGKLKWAGAMRAEAQQVLATDPDHPGANHLMGRLHAAVERMGRTKRFLARTLFDGEALAGASWASAREHLARAERDAPCQPEHHLELARLHQELGEVRQAREEARHVLELMGSEGAHSHLWRGAAALMERLSPPGHAGSSVDL
ncbi:MAG: hypothetical protein P8188_17175 [Gemmatimonadota bacterium]|jgi:hypothetical protein